MKQSLGQVDIFFAEYHLEIDNGSEIIAWANRVLVSGEYSDLIIQISLLNMDDPWECNEAQKLLFQEYNYNDEEIKRSIQNLLLYELTRLISDKCDPYPFINIFYRIRNKYNSPEWMNKLFESFAYQMPDSTFSSLSKGTLKEVYKTIYSLKAELQNE